MKRTTRNNILRYAVAIVAVSIFLLASLLFCLGLSWIDDETNLPISYIAAVAGFVYVVWYVGKGITIKNDKEEQQ